MPKFGNYIVLAFLFCLSCNSSEPALELCDDDPLDDLQREYAVNLYRYSWNMGEGVTSDTTIDATIFFSEIGSDVILVAVEDVDLSLSLDTITADAYIFTHSFLSPHNHAYVRFGCFNDTAHLDLRFGALGFDDWYKADFSYR